MIPDKGGGLPTTVPFSGVTRWLRSTVSNVASIIRLAITWSIPVGIALILVSRGKALVWLWWIVSLGDYYVLWLLSGIAVLLYWRKALYAFQYYFAAKRDRIETVLVSKIARELAMTGTATISQLHKNLGLTHQTARDLRAELLDATFTTLDPDAMSGKSFTGKEPVAIVDVDHSNAAVISPRIQVLPLQERIEFITNVLNAIRTKQPSANKPLTAPADPAMLESTPYTFTKDFIQEFQFRNAELSKASIGRKGNAVEKVKSDALAIRIVEDE